MEGHTLLRPLLIALIRSNVNHRGGIFAITGPTTFSAAENFVNRLSNYTEIILSVSRQETPNMHRDPVPIALPNSHLRMLVSTLFWQDMGSLDKRTAIFPDVANEPVFTDYIAGEDRTLDYALTAAAP